MMPFASTNVLAPLGSFPLLTQRRQSASTGNFAGRGTAPLIVRSSASGVVRVSDIAKVINGAPLISRSCRMEWHPAAVLLTIKKEAGANVIRHGRRHQALLPQLICTGNVRRTSR